eukprot:scaffold34407_cov34-Attheya_sp.AAC.7
MEEQEVQDGEEQATHDGGEEAGDLGSGRDTRVPSAIVWAIFASAPSPCGWPDGQGQIHQLTSPNIYHGQNGFRESGVSGSRRMCALVARELGQERSRQKQSLPFSSRMLDN